MSGVNLQGERFEKELTELVKQTQADQLDWDILVQSTEYNEESDKPTEEMDGKTWTIDECYVSYHCMYRGEEFLMITFEQIWTCGNEVRTQNLIFLPPLGIRYFNVDTLAPYAVPANQRLTYDIHMLWLTIMEKHKAKNPHIKLDAVPGA